MKVCLTSELPLSWNEAQNDFISDILHTICVMKPGLGVKETKQTRKEERKRRCIRTMDEAKESTGRRSQHMLLRKCNMEDTTRDSGRPRKLGRNSKNPENARPGKRDWPSRVFFFPADKYFPLFLDSSHLHHKAREDGQREGNSRVRHHVISSQYYLPFSEFRFVSTTSRVTHTPKRLAIPSSFLPTKISLIHPWTKTLGTSCLEIEIVFL